MKRIRRIIRALDPKADATMGQRERLEAFRIRRVAVLVLVRMEGSKKAKA